MSTNNIPFLNIKMKIILHYAKYGICSKGPKNKFKTAMVNKPSVFEPLKFYCIVQLSYTGLQSTPRRL